MTPRSELMQHWPALVRASRAVVGSREDAEDCAADAVLAALTQRDGVADDRAWLVTVSQRRAVDEVRRQVRGRVRHGRLQHHVDVARPDIADEVAEQAEARWLAAQAQTLLTPAAQAVLAEVAAGASVADAADALGITKRAAENHLHRARLSLRAAWVTTLVVVGWLTGGLRRLLPAAPVAVLAAAAFMLVPSTGAAPAYDGRMPLESPASRVEPARAVPVPAVARPIVDRTTTAPGIAATVPAAVEPGLSVRPRPAPSPLEVAVSGVGVEVRQEERDGPSDPVGIVVDCATHLEVGLEKIGC